ncbi:efflux RND transporter periplasmic adaptor subunit [Wenzhouxiangella sp. XN79A]|uniref:efflux RND transporter periplasmic adaptor subunit n=1 Tax=Wenzhouxiangella sp. XN79A TaxID=2724193 RepID=UPI00144A86B2|nr:efflux RND transporter periplasmic adaptor subunit [Wenzhouxiangella sp. XN79A]NKI34716.1 efflux RND transporter periplasmic adaptor subunit [Wenzhouxiangella sp. XN79A]
MSRAPRLLIGIVILVVLLGGLFGLRYLQLQAQKEQMAQAPPPATVEVVEAAEQRWRSALTAIGSLRAVNGIRVANEVAGVVDSIEFESGQAVEAGDVLIHLDDETDRAALETRQAEAQLARQQFERFSDLIGQDAVSRAQFDEAQANAQAAQARVHEQEALVAKKTIRAPFAGVLGLRQVDLGQFIPVGTPIVEINMLDPIQVDFTLGERDLPRIAVGDPVRVRVAAYPDDVFEGTILAIESSVRPATRTVEVRARLANPDARLRPGMFANVTAFRREQRNVVTVPRTAISYNTYGDFVFALREGEGENGTTVERVQVRTGEVRDGRVEIVDGVEAGQRVVAAGLLRLRNGQSVDVADGEAAETQ